MSRPALSTSAAEAKHHGTFPEVDMHKGCAVCGCKKSLRQCIQHQTGNNEHSPGISISHYMQKPYCKNKHFRGTWLPTSLCSGGGNLGSAFFGRARVVAPSMSQSAWKPTSQSHRSQGPGCLFHLNQQHVLSREIIPWSCIVYFEGVLLVGPSMSFD